MFCKYCGNKIDPEAAVCPKCGKTIRFEGGNGFWDMAGEPKPVKAAPLPPPTERERVVVKEVTRWSRIPIVIGTVLCLAGLVLFVSGKISAEKELRSIRSEYEEEIAELSEELTSMEAGSKGDLFEAEEQLAAAKEKLADAEEKLAAAEAKLSETETRLSETEEQLSEAQAKLSFNETEAEDAAGKTLKENSSKSRIKITKPPTSESKVLGCDGDILFVIKFSGDPTSIIWEKRDGNGEWQKLRFNKEGLDERYGIRNEEDLKLGKIVLFAAGLTEDSDGDYRCTVKNETGSASCEATLTILLPKEEKAASSSQESASDDEAKTDAEEEDAANPEATVTVIPRGGRRHG